MKKLTVRLPRLVVAQIEAESRSRKVSKSEVIRERLTLTEKMPRRGRRALDGIADLIGSVDALPCDLSKRTKKYLRSTSYRGKRAH
jgi:Arc/MetJ-type ribon-helix-helix transcriptional regulator